MLKYEDYLAENLMQNVVSEPSSEAAAEARKLGLTYLGFGRYSDQTGQVAYTVQRGRLVPFKHGEQLASMMTKAHEGAKDANTAQQQIDAVNKAAKLASTVQNRDAKALKATEKDAARVNKELQKIYTPQNYTPEEVAALANYTDNMYQPVNNYLYKGFDDMTDPNTIQAVQDTINAMDAMIDRSVSPMDYIVYTGLSARYNPNDFRPGKSYVFKGYTSCSLNYNVTLDLYGQTQQSPRNILQIDVQKGHKALYVDSLTGSTSDKEVILPRGSKIEILSGPHMIDDQILTNYASGEQVALFHCQLIQEV